MFIRAKIFRAAPSRALLTYTSRNPNLESCGALLALQKPCKQPSEQPKSASVTSYRTTRAITTWKSSTCYGVVTQEPLSVYTTKYYATNGALHAKARHGSKFHPYKCEACGFWHISPEERHTPSTVCEICTNADFTSKKSYESRVIAQRRADLVLSEKNTHLVVYPCPHGHGWHLTTHDTVWNGER
jgi:hypothetical protein